MKPKVVTFAVAILILGGWSMYQAFAQDHLLAESGDANAEVADLKQQVTKLLERVERLESELDEVTQITTDVGFTFARPFPGEAHDGDTSEPSVFIQLNGTEEGMMIDAIEHSRNWLW